jgi:hypothetical protein
MFEYPVGIQLFNRPEYAMQMLKSIQDQSYRVNAAELFIYIDGFIGSISEKNGAIDRTKEVEVIARSMFPTSRVRRFVKNQGLAHLRNQLQKETFSSGASWAAFFEEDLVLDSTYLQELSDLINTVDDYQEVSKVACLQIIDSVSHLPRGYVGFYPGRGTQAIAERRSFFLQKQPAIEKYIELIEGEVGNFQQFKNTEIASKMAGFGFVLKYFQHDSLEEQVLHTQGKLHIVTKPNLALDIGIHGVHNYVTKKIIHSETLVNESRDERAKRFERELAQVRVEASQDIERYFQEILDSYHISKSRKLMIKRIWKGSRKHS